ncbi:MAG TPA: DUF2490 domain-containing protein [Bacteroidales bacterium]|nr:DUF2490 domain-containing protein [Bacteroidales bacterium]
MHQKSVNIPAFFCLLILSFSGKAQQRDFQVWPSASVSIEFLRNTKFQVEEEVRFRENSSLLSREINDFGFSYRFSKYFRAGIFYRIEADYENADDYSWRNGLYSDMAFRFGFNRFTAGYRLRLQSAKVEKNENDYLFSGFRHRHKISLEYDIKGIPLVPFIDSELFVDSKDGIKGMRSWVGLEYQIKKVHSVALKYGIDREINSNDPVTAYILALGYSLDLSLLTK